MEDPYLISTVGVDRLVREWRTYGKLIIAYDFDDTVFDYHKQDHTYPKVTQLLRECREQGAWLIVFTACGEDKYPEIRKYLEDNDIPFDTINEPVYPTPFTGRKMYYNSFLDDRAGLRAEYEKLKAALYIMRGGPQGENSKNGSSL